MKILFYDQNAFLVIIVGLMDIKNRLILNFSKYFGICEHIFKLSHGMHYVVRNLQKKKEVYLKHTIL